LRKNQNLFLNGLNNRLGFIPDFPRAEVHMRANEFAELSAFVAVADELSFTKAAVRLGLSPASLSLSVRALEERLGVRLLNRTTRSVAPTDAGQRMLGAVRPLLDGFQTAIESVNVFRDKPAGHLRLTMAPTGSLLLATPLAEFVAAYPQITIEISVDSAYVDIVAARFDAGFRPGHKIAKDMIALRVSDDMRVVVAASPRYLARYSRPKTPADLREHNCIRFRLPSGNTYPWNFRVRGKNVEVEVGGSLVVNDPQLTINLALEGAGLMYSAEGFVAPMIADGRLISLLDDSSLPRLDGLYMYYPSRRQNSAALQALINFLRTNSKTRQ
jgi:DNA-binding transcriptional LysR family regulator